MFLCTHAVPSANRQPFVRPFFRGLLRFLTLLAFSASTSFQKVSWGIPAPSRNRFRAACRIACSFGEWPISRRSKSSSSSVRSRTATGLPLRVTTTGPNALALRYLAKSEATAVSVATFTIPLPLHRRIGGSPFSHRWPGLGRLGARHQLRKARGNDYLVQIEVPTSPRKALAAGEAYDYGFPFLVRKVTAPRSPNE